MNIKNIIAHLMAAIGTIMVICISQENIMFCIGLALMIYGLLNIGGYIELLNEEKAMCIICDADEELARKVVHVIEEHKREKKKE